MSLHLYNSLTRRKEEFVPQDPQCVTLYACGPTVYNPPHIGNARAAVVYDLLYRVLQARFPNVVYARNITDVDDKINAAAKQEGVPISVITARYTEVYHRDMQALGVLPPTIEPRATDHIDTIIAMIQRLIERGNAYEAEGHVLFNVPSFGDYGRLSGRDTEEMLAGARVEIAPYKKDPADFVLWKPSSDDLPGWDSPWGRGRPGWHIECSAMIERHLGETIDIHGGGNDLKFPHHENEIAQGTCAHDGRTYCRYWVHNGFVQIDDEKMSKSLGNILLVDDLLERYPGEAIRYALLMARYREPLNWTDGLVSQAKAALDHLYGALERLSDVFIDEDEVVPSAVFDAALDDDLNTPEALKQLKQLAKAANVAEDPAEKRRLKAALLGGARLLGVLQQGPQEWFSSHPALGMDKAEIEALIAKRDAARAAKDYQEADRIRDLLADSGVEILDGPEGTQWRSAN